MPSFLDLPGELRNEIYYAVYDHDRAVTLTSNGNIKLPNLAHVSTQIRREALSIFEEIASCPHAIKATIADLDFSHLTAFVQLAATAHRQQFLDLTMRFDKPELQRDEAIQRLEAFLRHEFTAAATVHYQVDFNWRAYDIASAQRVIRDIVNGLHLRNLNVIGNGLMSAMAVARQAQVKRTLVERPARQRLQVSQGGRDFRHMRMD